MKASVVTPKTLQPLVRLNRDNGEGEPLMRWGLIPFIVN
jgi:hypothetical protein